MYNISFVLLNKKMKSRLEKVTYTEEKFLSGLLKSHSAGKNAPMA